MAGQKFTELSTRKLNEALQSRSVRAALTARAARIIPNTRAIAIKAGAREFAAALEVVHGTRPGSKARGGLQRPYARVQATVTSDMRRKDSGAKLQRRVILRRGARG